MTHLRCTPATLEAGTDTRVGKSGVPKKRKLSPPQESPTARLTGTFIALEPRILFDGAALATGAEVVQDTTAQDQPGVPGIESETSTDSTHTNSSDEEAFWSSRLSLSASSDRKEIVFIDTRVENYQTLMDGIDPAAEVILLDTRRDGIDQIAEALEGRSAVDAIHLIGEGTEAELHLGTAFLTNDSIHGPYAELFGQIGQSLSDDADLLIYGCNFGRGPGGLSAIQALADLTGADIAASTDRTGHVSEYANWNLEVSTGLIETSVIMNAVTQAAWEGVLATYTVTNTNDAGAGSLRQAITDANANAGTDSIAFAIPTGDAGYDAGRGVFTITVTSLLPAITDALTIDGSTQAVNIGNTNTGLLGAGGTVGVDALTLSQVARPEIEIVDGAGLTTGLALNASNVTIRSVAIYGFGSTSSNGNITIGSTAANALIEDNIIGADASTFSAPAPGAKTEGSNIYSAGGDNGIIRNNLIGFATESGINLLSGSNNWLITGNELRGNAFGSSNMRADAIATNSNSIGQTVQGNLIVANAGPALDLITATGSLVDNNTVSNNGSASNESAGIRARSSNLTISKNISSGNAGAGVMIRSGSSTGNLITQNSIYGNGTGPGGGIGIDLLPAGDPGDLGTAPFVTPNDAGDADTGGNNLMNFPVIYSVQVSGTTVTVTGEAGAGATVEFFKSAPNVSGYGEGETYLDSGLVSGSTPGSVDASARQFSFSFSTSLLAAGDRLTATANDASNNTSEFSANVVVNHAPIAADDRSGLTFDGVDDYVQLGNDVSLEMSNTMTMEAWFRPTSFPTSSSALIINKEGEYEVGIFPDGSIRWALANTDPGWSWYDTGYVVPLNEWTHVAITYSSGTVITYVNGSPVDTYNGSGSIGDAHPTLDDLRIGGRSNNPTGQYFEGSISEVRIWNVARTGVEIATNYNQWLTGAETGLVGNWRLTEGVGTVATDISPSSNNGALGGGTPFQEPTWVGYATNGDSPLNIPMAGVLTNDIDVDSDPFVVSEVNGNAANIGNPISLASGALVTLNADGSFNYDPNGQFDNLDSGQQTFDQFAYTIDDGNGGTDTGTVYVTINGVNDAPVLAPAAPSLTTIAEDDTGNSGDLISNIVGASIADVDSGAVEGIAITGLNSGTGTWEYNTGSGWTPVGAVSNGSALLLRATDSVRFVPNGLNADSATVTYRAWDQTSGTEGTKVDVSTNGGTTAYSTATDTATVTVTGVNDAPVITSNGGGPTAAVNVAENQTSVTTVRATDVDVPADTLTYSIIGGADAGLFSLNPTSGVLTFTGAPDFETPADADANNIYEVTVQVSDGNGGADTQMMSITVTDTLEGVLPLPLQPLPQPYPIPTPDPGPHPISEPPSDIDYSTTRTPSSEFPGFFDGQPPLGRDLSRRPGPQPVRDWSRVLDVAPFLRPAVSGTTTEQIRSYAPAPVLISHIELGREFLQQLNAFSQDLQETTQQAIDERSFFITMMEYTGLGVSGVLLAWLVRSGTLLASVLASLPAWRNFDPIAILDMDKQGRESWTKRMKEASQKEAGEYQGLDQMLDPEVGTSSTPSISPRLRPSRND
ncbi:DUF4347 domain-containing protein [Candidatus Nitrospira neomarina]|uniref:DUF4347 domain-containing protein n=1 Tax=Candidatus Nitrospira neomarina TaxID=3020899 RepID=A0AA96K289_9BACT|nr:DUF4347 domain-containing protein [Candidatus Nitrospira neomarina]WNM63856.1 DUF4347 domain-containing protein [Candidatus Nitrospira neomarina]